MKERDSEKKKIPNDSSVNFQLETSSQSPNSFVPRKHYLFKLSFLLSRMRFLFKDKSFIFIFILIVGVGLVRGQDEPEASGEAEVVEETPAEEAAAPAEGKSNLGTPDFLFLVILRTSKWRLLRSQRGLERGSREFQKTCDI